MTMSKRPTTTELMIARTLTDALAQARARGLEPALAGSLAAQMLGAGTGLSEMVELLVAQEPPGVRSSPGGAATANADDTSDRSDVRHGGDGDRDAGGDGGDRSDETGTATLCWLAEVGPWADLRRNARQAAVRATDLPVAVVPAKWLIALLMVSRRSDAVRAAVALLATGSVDVDGTREVVRSHLGPYAVDDFDALLQEAEWQAMCERYRAGDTPIH